MATIGFIGSGHIGSQLARLAVRNGYGPRRTADELRRDLAAAKRSAQL